MLEAVASITSEALFKDSVQGGTQCSSYGQTNYAAPFKYDSGQCMYCMGLFMENGCSVAYYKRFCPCTCAAATPYSCGTNAVCEATTTPTCVLPGQDASGQEASSTGGATVGAGAGVDTAGVGAGTAGAGAADGGAAQDASSTGSGASITIGSGSIKLGSGSIKFGNEL